MMIQNAIEIAPVYPLIDEAIRSTNAKRVLMCEREERIKGLPFRIHELFTDHPPFG